MRDLRAAATDLRARRLPSPMALLTGGILVAALLALVFAGLARALGGDPSAAERLVGQPAPAFSLPAQQDGRALPEPVALADARGHPVVLVFFYTLCAHCLSQLGEVHDAVRGAPAGATDLFIDTPGERPDVTQAYFRRLYFQPPVLSDADGRVAARYGVAYSPTVVLVDGAGIVRHVWVGETDAATIRAAIMALPR